MAGGRGLRKVVPNSTLTSTFNLLCKPSSPCSSTASSPPTPTPAPTDVPSRKRPPPTPISSASAKRPSPELQLPEELGKFVTRDVALLRKLGWVRFVKQRRREGDFGSLNFQHPARRLLRAYKHRGVPVRLSTKPWSKNHVCRALLRGPHGSCFDFLEFLQGEFIDMINKQQWVVLPFSSVKDLPGLRLSPPGCIPQRDRRPRWICDYTWSGVNPDTIPIAALEAMQFGHALERILREILTADPALGPIYMMKLDIADRFYRVNLAIRDIPKLGVVFPTLPGQEPLVALPLVLPCGWKISPPAFSTATETAADIVSFAIGAPTAPSQ